MNIMDIRVKAINDDSKLKAVASITFDSAFAVHDIKVIEGDNRLFIAMPSKKDGEGTYRDICHPINSETRKIIQDAVIDKYNEILALKAAEEET